MHGNWAKSTNNDYKNKLSQKIQIHAAHVLKIHKISNLSDPCGLRIYILRIDTQIVFEQFTVWLTMERQNEIHFVRSWANFEFMCKYSNLIMANGK